jgi:hypothetical protein
LGGGRGGLQKKKRHKNEAKKKRMRFKTLQSSFVFALRFLPIKMNSQKNELGRNQKKKNEQKKSNAG